MLYVILDVLRVDIIKLHVDIQSREWYRYYSIPTVSVNPHGHAKKHYNNPDVNASSLNPHVSPCYVVNEI